MKNHYKEKFWDYDNDQLKDIIAGRFSEPSDDEVAAAMELLRERNSQNRDDNSTLSLAQIPGSSMSVLLEIVKNPGTWGVDAVDIAEAEILRREHRPLESSQAKGAGKEKKTVMQIILAVIGVVLSIILIKLIAAILLICFFFYSVMSCLDNL